MALDATTQANLELFRSAVSGQYRRFAAIGYRFNKDIDGRAHAQTLAGAAASRFEKLTVRQDSVGWFLGDNITRRQIIDKLGDIADLERLTNRIRSNIALPQELKRIKTQPGNDSGAYKDIREHRLQSYRLAENKNETAAGIDCADCPID